MKEYKEIPRDRGEAEQGVPRIDLPRIIERPRERGRALMPALLALLLLCAVICSVILLSPRSQTEIYAPPTPTESEEWRGAFADRGVMLECLASSVSISVGRRGRERSWSGFAVSEDGWIATCAAAVGEGTEGQIRVTFGDGSEYGVEAIRPCGEMALLKISAKGLSTVREKDGETFAGEKLICISQGSEAVTAEVARVFEDGTASISTLLGEQGAGAPVFDGDGALVGMATVEGAQEQGRITKMIPVDMSK